MSPKDPLPSKENALFKKILKCYELKQYRQGLKFARQILSNARYAEHGETLSMKGLILNSIGRKEEAYDNVRRGLRNDLTSHVCWHVFGLLQRSDRKYDEAIKAYRNALRWDKDNLQILRDLSLLQIQMRDYDGYRETRQRLLELRPGQRASWIGYALSWHLLKDYDMALCVIDEFRKTLQAKPYDYDYSEIVLYQSSILEEAGRYQEALAFLEKHDKDIVDRLYLDETRARLLYLTEDTQQASVVYKSLLDRNPENWAYYTNLEQCVKPATVEDRMQLYTDVLKNNPRASAPRKLPLAFITGDYFTSQIDQYLRNAIRKGVPSLFMSMKAVYADPVKVQQLEELVLSYHRSLKVHQLFHPEDKQDYKEAPTCTLWTEVFLAQHYDFLGGTRTALVYIESAINDTPTSPELYMIKGRIFKHAGNMREAVRCLDEAQSLDTADRYINSKCAKFMIRNDMLTEAETLCKPFSREGMSPMDSLNEMQCMWFQIECANSYARRHEWGNALKKCHEIDRHFIEITEDQFDFHTYCLRKSTLRSYISLLRLEDVLRNHRFYFKAASTAIKIYLHLHTNPVNEDSDDKNGNPSNLSASELKKLKNKQRKAQLKAEKARDEETKRQQAANSTLPNTVSKKPGGEEPETPKEDELVPSKLETCVDPLEQAIRFLKPLQTLCSFKIESHIFAYEIYSRKAKPLLMLKAIKGGVALKSNDPQFHVCMVKFLHYVRDASGLPESVQKVLTQSAAPIYNDVTPQEFNETFLENNKLSLGHRLAAAKAMFYLESSRQTEALKLACCLDDNITGRNFKNCSEVLESLRRGDLGSCDDCLADYTQKCHTMFPHASVFASCNGLATNGPVDNCTSQKNTSTINCHEVQATP